MTFVTGIRGMRRCGRRYQGRRVGIVGLGPWIGGISELGRGPETGGGSGLQLGHVSFEVRGGRGD